MVALGFASYLIYLKKIEGIFIWGIYLAFSAESSFLPTKFQILEYRTYYPSIYIFMLLAILYSNYANHLVKKFITTFCLSFIVYFMLQTHLYIENNNTNVKRILNEYLLIQHSTDNTLRVLDDLLGVEAFAEGKKLCEKILQDQPQNSVYSMYLNIFRYNELAHGDQEKSINALGLYILRNKDLNVFASSTMIAFIEKRIGAFSLDPLLRSLKLEILFRAHYKKFSNYAALTDWHKKFLISILVQFDKLGRLPDKNEALQFIHILGQSSYYFPVYRSSFKNKVQSLILLYPEHSINMRKIANEYSLMK
jgi:hypothetical protein